MALTNTEYYRDEIDKKIRQYFDAIKIRTQCNLNDSAVNGEGFIRNLLNLLYQFNLTKEKIESPYNETIDLHNIGSENPTIKICVQVTARNEKSKIDTTIKAFINKAKYKLYDELHFFILDRKKEFDYNEYKLKEYGTKIIFHDYTTIFKKLCSLDSHNSIIPIYEFIQKEIGDPSSLNKLPSPPLKELFGDLHIVDQLYNVLKLFNGLKCVHPRTVAKMWPFNSNRFAHNTYSRFCLKTDNIEIHKLLEKVTFEQFNVKVLDKSLEPYIDKLNEIFSILNHSTIRCICYREDYTEIKHHKIRIQNSNNECQCNFCRYSQFKIKPLADDLESKTTTPLEKLDDPLSDAYYLYKLSNPIESWKILDSIINTTDNDIIKFIAQFNSKNHFSAISAPWLKNKAKEIRPKIDNIDLIDSLSDLNINKEVRDELARIKEEKHIYDSRRKIEELVTKIVDLKKSFSISHGTFLGPSYISQLWNELAILRGYYISNHILADDFISFRHTIQIGIKGIIASYQTSEIFNDRYKEFDEFIVSLILDYFTDQELEKLLKEEQLHLIKITESAKLKILNRIKNFFEFQYHKGVFNKIHVYDYIHKLESFSRFRQELRYTFNKIMMLLERSNFTDEELTALTEPMVNYLQSSEDFDYNSWKFFTRFLENRIQIFDRNKIEIIIDQTLNGINHLVGEEVLGRICYVASEKYSFIIAENSKIQKLIKSAIEPCGNCNRIHNKETVLAYWPIFDSHGKKIIEKHLVELLDKKFDGILYQNAAFSGVLNMNNHTKLFNKFVDYAINCCSSIDIKENMGRWYYHDYSGINALSCLSYIGFDFQDKKMNKIAEKSDFYSWVINPMNYDYSKFNVKWLIDLCKLDFLRNNLHKIEPLREKIEAELQGNYDKDLSEFYVKHLMNE